MSQTVSAQLGLRELVLNGALEPGARVTETGLVDQLGMSRTPVRAALAKLAEEGLLDPLPSGGYAVRQFSETDISDAIEVRGTLEGLCARTAAERGADPAGLAELHDLLARIDDVLARNERDPEAFSDYVGLNERFHAVLSTLAGSRLLAEQLSRATSLPFASPSGFVRTQAALPAFHHTLLIAQEQHRTLVEAIERREGARAEALAREHARLARRNLHLGLRNHAAATLLPGSALIRLKEAM
jgi:GntR family transcriptional regulator of vanillate catabolism